MKHFVSAKMDGFSPERRNREIAEKITLLLESESNYQKTGNRDKLGWEAFLFVLPDTEIPPCIWMVNDEGAGDVLEFATDQDAREVFLEMQEAAKEKPDVR